MQQNKLYFIYLVQLSSYHEEKIINTITTQSETIIKGRGKSLTTLPNSLFNHGTFKFTKYNVLQPWAASQTSLPNSANFMHESCITCPSHCCLCPSTSIFHTVCRTWKPWVSAYQALIVQHSLFLPIGWAHCPTVVHVALGLAAPCHAHWTNQPPPEPLTSQTTKSFVCPASLSTLQPDSSTQTFSFTLRLYICSLHSFFMLKKFLFIERQSSLIYTLYANTPWTVMSIYFATGWILHTFNWLACSTWHEPL